MTYLRNISIRLLRAAINRAAQFTGRTFRFEFDFFRILYKNFPEGSDFFLVLVGANDGISHDDLFPFIKCRRTKGIAIEPLEDFYKQLSENFRSLPGIKTVQLAVHAQKQTVTLHRLAKEFEKDYPDWVQGIASLDARHHQQKVAPQHMVAEEVNAAPLMKILESDYPYDSIDLLQIDVEGYDGEVLRMFDFHKFKPKIIRMETESLGVAQAREAADLLESKGYYHFQQGPDMVAVQQSIIRL